MANCEFMNYIHSNETCLTWINKRLGFLCMLHPPNKINCRGAVHKMDSENTPQLKEIRLCIKKGGSGI